MFHRSPFARRVSALIAASTIALATSCGPADDGLGKRYAVSGKVTYNGQPLGKGNISFIPMDGKGVGASGAIKDGYYTLMTGGNADGAQAGKYKVTIAAKEDSLAQAKANFAKDTKGIDPGYLPGRYIANAEAKAKSLIPLGYGDFTTTNQTAEVKEGSNAIDFQLSDADAPAAPKAQPAGRSRPKG